MRGATRWTGTSSYSARFQSTLLMRGATHVASETHQLGGISIHAPHARSDEWLCPICGKRHPFQSTLLMRGATRIHASRWAMTLDFNPRSSCEERQPGVVDYSKISVFQSTLLMRGATRRCKIQTPRRTNFNPRSSCEERPGGLGRRAHPLDISIHAPHARSDAMVMAITPAPRDFNPRSSCEERPQPFRFFAIRSNFNPRSSCEERLADLRARSSREPEFQSTLLMRGATSIVRMERIFLKISIHAPHARSDAAADAVTCW